MPINSRNKGATAEREAAELLSMWLQDTKHPHLTPTRNLEQTRAGGFDLVGIPGLAIEVKRVENLSALPGWWKQAVRQAPPPLTPFLMYRPNRKPWKFRIRVWVWPAPKPLDTDFDLLQAEVWFKAYINKLETPDG